MLNQKTVLLFYALPFLVALLCSFFNVYFLNEVIGNTSLGLAITLAISLYFFVLTLLTFRLNKSVISLLSLAILASLFLPVRQNIAVISTTQVAASQVWLERSYFTSTLSVYKAENGLVLTPKRVRLLDEVIYEAYLEKTDAGVYLVYRKNKGSPYVSEKL